MTGLLARSVMLAGAISSAATALVGLALDALSAVGPELVGSSGEPRLEALLTLVASVALLGCVAWSCLGVLAALLEVATGSVPAALRRVTPPLVRRAVLIGCGAAVGSTVLGGTALAEPPRGNPGSAVVRSALSGLPLPDRVAGTGPRRRVAETVVVGRGDSLWSITAGRLGADAPAAQVAAGWQALYAANRPTIGADPDQLTTGTRLRLPSGSPFAALPDSQPTMPTAPSPAPHREDTP